MSNLKRKLTLKTRIWIKDILDSEEYQEAKKKKLINMSKLSELFGISDGVIYHIKIKG